VFTARKTSRCDTAVCMPANVRDCVWLAVERRCQEIMTHNMAFVSSLETTFHSQMIKFPKAVRAMRTEDLLGIEASEVESIKSNADAILLSCRKPSRPPLMPRGPETPMMLGKSTSFMAPPGSVARSSDIDVDAADPTNKLIMTAFVSKVRQPLHALLSIRLPHDLHAHGLEFWQAK
jgi:hypothetical protein